MIAQIIHVWHLKHSVAVQYHNFFIAVHCEISFIIRSVSMWLFGWLGFFCGLFGIFLLFFFFNFSSFLQISFWRKQKRLLQIQEINSNCICCHSRTNIIFDISMHFFCQEIFILLGTDGLIEYFSLEIREIDYSDLIQKGYRTGQVSKKDQVKCSFLKIITYTAKNPLYASKSVAVFWNGVASVHKQHCHQEQVFLSIVGTNFLIILSRLGMCQNET